MLVALVVLFVVTFVMAVLKKVFTNKVWIMIFVLGLISSFILAYVSVASVWVPHQLSDNVYRQQNALGEYEGAFPLSKLSYPLYLRVYHTPFRQLIFEEDGTAYGQAHFSVILADIRVI